MAKTLFELTEGNAPALTDYALTGEDPLGTHVLRRTTWQSIRNLFVGATTAANDFIVGNGTVWQKKTLAETKTALGIDALTAVDGWVTVTDTWTYATATTFTISGDKTGVYSVGDKIKLTQTTVKYFYIVAISYSSPNTTVTVTGGSTYSLANATITSPYYSKAASPAGFPAYFGLTDPTFTSTGTAFTNQPTSKSFRFIMNGRLVFLSGGMQNHATSGATGQFIATFTAGQLPPVADFFTGTAINQSTRASGFCYVEYAQNKITMHKYDVTTLAGNSEYYNCDVIYRV
jgi:hypothetical protein